MAVNFVAWCIKHIDWLEKVDYDFTGFSVWIAGETAGTLVNKKTDKPKTYTPEELAKFA
jgi:hypothetical protein